jgi:hypothetical protein
MRKGCQVSARAFDSRDPREGATPLDALRAAAAGRATILDAHAQGIEQVVLLFADDAGGRLELHLVLLGPRLCYWLEPAGRGSMRAALDDARGATSAAGGATSAGSGFGDWLRRHLAGARIGQVSAGASGRVLKLELAWPAEPAADAIAALVLDPAPGTHRLLVLDGLGRVAQRYPPTAHASPRGRGAPGSRYEEPRDRQIEERGDSRSDERGDAHGDEPSDGRGNEPGAAGSVEPVESREWGLTRIRFARGDECARRVRQLLRGEARRLERLSVGLAKELEESGGGEQWRRKAEALLAHAQRVPKGARRVTLDDPSHPGETLTIDLDPTLGFSQNARNLFRKAARFERAHPAREKKAASCTALLASVREWLELPALVTAEMTVRDATGGALASPDPLAHLIAELQTALREARRGIDAVEPGIRRRWQKSLDEWRDALAACDRPIDRAGYDARRIASGKPVEAGTHPRRFVLDGGWEVLVGRSNRENDILTHKLAKAEDLWFHARGVAGSHVILRCAGRAAKPPKTIIEQAAAIAAHFSKARTSAMVPVAYTEKRYVRKPRKATPGLAVCLREKVLMVRPSVPEEAGAAPRVDGSTRGHASKR